MKKIAFIILAIFAAVSMQAQSPLNWIGDTDIEPFQESTQVHQGSYSCGIIVNSGVQANCDFDNEITIDVVAGETFKMSFWGYTSEFVRGRAKIVWSDNTTMYATTYLGPNTGGWEQFSFEGEIPADITTATVGVRFYDVSGFTAGEIQYLDDFVFESPIGNPITVANGDMELWSGLTPEPDNYPTDFVGQPSGLGAILSWIDAVGGQLPSSYLVKASTEDDITLPEDGVYVADDFDLSDGSGAVNVGFGTQTTTFPSLEASATYYFKIFSYTNSGANVDYKNDGTPPATQVETSETVVIVSQNFDESFGLWSPVSVIGDQVWDRDNTYGIGGTACAKMTGYDNGTVYENEDWLISPSMNLNAFENELLTFYTAVGYITADPQFVVRISTDYDGGGDPSSANWTDLQPILPDGSVNWEWTYSGDVDISGFDGDNVYVAFIYYCGADAAATYELEDVVITGEGQFIPDPEPTNYPEAFAAQAMGQHISLSWTDATGDQLPAGYLILGSDQDDIGLPTDGTPVENDLDFSDGQGVLNVALGVEECSFADLLGEVTYYFKIFPYTNTGTFIDYKSDGTPPAADATTVTVSYILSTDFNDDWGGWTPVSVIGDQVWDRENTFGMEDTPCALMSGYNGANNENEDWLISPALDFSVSNNEVLRFYTARNYSGPDLVLKASIDYDGGGDPYTANWTDITDMVIWSNGSFIWTESGAVSLSQFSGNTVYLAYQFFSTIEASSNWEIDNIVITQEELVGEPTNYPMSFVATAVQQSITLTWDDATGEILPEAYLIKANTQNVIVAPVDGIPIPNDPDLSDGTAYMNIVYGVETHTFTGLLENTTYYFKIYPYTSSGSLIDYKTDGTAPGAFATTEEDFYDNLLFTTFDESWESWEQVSIVGDQVWDRDNTYGIGDTPCAKMSGYSGASLENEDWLISPSVDVSGFWYEEQVVFNTAVGYSGEPLEFKLSTDYTGNGDPYSATWIDLSDQAVWPTGDPFFEWTNSGAIDISELVAYPAVDIHIAFVYNSTVEQSATWEVDNIYVQAMFAEGVEELDGKTIEIYPNPGNGIFNIESQNELESIEVFTITGNLVHKQITSGNVIQLNLSQIPKGIYLVRGYEQDTGNVFHSRIVIQ